MGPRGLKLSHLLTGLLSFAFSMGGYGQQTLQVGSKRFTESYVLGEIVARTANGVNRPGLGNTGIVYAALKSGSIDVYP